jgi:EmrB/QacA subfamily drug resistance transporter
MTERNDAPPPNNPHRLDGASPNTASADGTAPRGSAVPARASAPEGASRPAADTSLSAAVEAPTLDRHQLILALAGVLLCILVAALDQTIVGTALPRIVAELNGFDRYNWVVTAYLLTATCVIPISGKLSDQFGRKPILIFGLVVFVLGSMLSGASQTMNQLILFRGLQGIGAGALQSGAFASIGDLFSPAERGKWQGVIAASFGIASVFGPSLGGWITDNLGWRWVFYVNLPVGAVALATLIYGFPGAGTRRHGRRIDWLGVATIVLAVVPLLVGLTWAGVTYPWGSVQVIASLGFSLVMFVAFYVAERAAAEPLLPLDLFRNQIFTSAAIASFFIGPLFLGLGIYLPLFVQGVLRQSATSSGAIITPMTLGTVVTNIIGGQLISRTGRYRIIALAGLVITIFGTLLTIGMGPNTDTFTLVRNMIITGLGFGFVLPVYTIAVQNAMPYNRLGVVTSSVQFTRSIGSTIGVAILGTVVSTVYASSFAKAQTPALTRALAAAAASGHALPSDPQVLVSPAAQAAIQAGFERLLGPQAGGALYSQFLAAVQSGLLDAIRAAFFTMLICTVVALIATLFLKEIPLRRSVNDTRPTQPGASAEGEREAPPAIVMH